MKGKNSIVWVALMICLFFFTPARCLAQSDETGVPKKDGQAVKITFYAVSPSGEAIPDLDPKDVGLTVNGVVVPDFQLKKIEGAFPENRLVVLVLDSMFCTNYGVKRARDIAQRLIESASPQDALLVLVNSSNEGLSHLVGPTTDKDKVLKAVKKTKLFAGSQWFQDVFSRKNTSSDRFSADSDYSVNEFIRPPDRVNSGATYVNQYIEQVKFFTQKLIQVQVGLQMIERPKVMYYISEGYQEKDLSPQMDDDRTKSDFARESGGSLTIPASRVTDKADTSRDIKEQTLSGVVFDYSKKMIETFKKGGNVIFAINPGKLKTMDYGSSGSMNLEFLMDRKGSYFQSLDLEKLLSDVQSAASSGFELIPAVNINPFNINTIEMKTSRDGAVLHAPWFWGRKPAYRELNENEQKAFAVNIVTGGLLSHVAGEAETVPYKKKTTKAEGGGSKIEIDVAVPSSLENKTADVFFVVFEKNTKRWGVIKNRKSLAKTEKLTRVLMDVKNNTAYFAIVEPGTGRSLYNEIT